MFTQPPIEDQLAWHTLWPESHKLYGHGNELFSLCCDHEGKLVASSCKVYVVMLLFLLVVFKVHFQTRALLCQCYSQVVFSGSTLILIHLASLQAQSAMVAEIWLWQVGSWKAVGQLQSHSLTVTQMEFSHDDNMLLAVSRDRQFSVFSIKRTGIFDP